MKYLEFQHVKGYTQAAENNCRWGGLKKPSSADPEFMHISDIVGWKMLLLSSMGNHGYRVMIFFFFNTKLHTSAGEWSCLSLHHMYLGDKDYSQ